MTVMDNWCLFSLDESVPMKDKYRKEANLIDSQNPILVAKKEEHSKGARIFFDKDRHEHILMLTKNTVEHPCFVATQEPNSLGHYMHLADMFLTDDVWEERIFDQNWIDEYNMKPLHLKDSTMIDFGVIVPKEVANGLYPNDPDPLDYHFGESACKVFERWSVELKKMRELCKHQNR